MSFTQVAQAAPSNRVPISPIEPTAILPAGITKYAALRLVRRLRKPLGLSETDLSVLGVLADPTRPEDWSDPLRQPINHQMQCDLAQSIGITDRSFRRSEDRLERLGLVAKNVPLNGYRSALRSYGSHQAAYGISLQPLIDCVEDLMMVEQEQRDALDYMSKLRVQIRILRRRVTKDIREITDSDPDDPLYGAFVESQSAWPCRIGQIRSVEVLEEHLDALQSFCGYVKENSSLYPNMSDASDTRVRSHIQTIRPNKVRCNDTSLIRPGDKSPEGCFDSPPPNGGGDCLEKKHRDAQGPVQSKTTDTQDNCPSVPQQQISATSSLSPAFVEALNPDVLFELISQDWRFILSALVQNGAAPRFEDFEMAAVHMLRELGISPSAYEQAISAMGPLDAMLSLIVIDRNRAHPTRPIHNPGGALRAFARKAEAGTLNLQNSVFGLLHRDQLN